MTIGKGTTWGDPAPLPSDGLLVHSDAEARDAIITARRHAVDPPVLGLLGGDLARTCGAPGDEARMRGEDAQTLPVDLGEVTVDGIEHLFVAHLVARRSWWRGRVFVAMNAQYLGRFDVAPKSHPNDGRLDVLDGDLSLGDRLKARTRLPTGTHVPHPGIDERRVKAIEVSLARGTRVWLDGVCVGAASTLSIRVQPDAFTVVV